MFARISFMFALALAVFARASWAPCTPSTVTTTMTVTQTVWEKPTSDPVKPGGNCNTGPVHCCEDVQPASNNAIISLLQSLGIPIPNVNVPIGVNCNPINILGIGGNNCNAQAVCCENNHFGGLVAIGCTPINIGL